jgi:hypothetical protein
MRLLVLLFVLFATPAVAGDWSPWLDRCEASGGAELLLAQASGQGQSGQGQSGQGQRRSGSGAQGQSEPRHPGDYCCVHCRHNEIPCGNTCLAKGGKETFCTEKRTCACPGKP